MSLTEQKNRNQVFCPYCESPEWKMASLVYAEGISNNTGTTSSVGVGVGSPGVGVGLSKGKYSGVSQSETSLRAAPPAPPLMDKALLIAFSLSVLVFIFLLLTNRSFFFAFIISIFAFVPLLVISIPLSSFYIRFLSEEQNEYEKSLQAWSQVKMCLRCGLFFDK